MTQITPEQREALETAGWTQAETTAFVEAVTAFRDGLPPRQQEAFNGILATAGAAAGGDDVQGHLVVIAVIGVLIGMLLPAVQKVSVANTPGNTPLGASAVNKRIDTRME